MNAVQQLDKFHKTKPGHLVFGLVELGLAYLFFSLAIDSGNLWFYLLLFIFLIGFLQNIVKLIGALLRGSK